MAATPPLQVEETERLAALRALGAVDRVEFDEIASLAGIMFGAPIALVTLFEEERVLFVGRWGVRSLDAPRGSALSAQMIGSREPTIVLDGNAEAHIKRHGAVLDANFRFFAGAPLLVRGQCIGSLCVADHEPRLSFGALDLEALERLAGMAVRLLQAQAQRATLAATSAKMVAAEARAAIALEEAASAFAACDRLAANLGGRFHDALVRLQCAAPIGRSETDLAIAEETAALLDMADELAAVARLEAPSSAGALYEPSDVVSAVATDWAAGMRESGVVLDLRDQARGVEILGDSLRFEELVENILLDLAGDAKGARLLLELDFEFRAGRAFLVLSLSACGARTPSALGWRMSTRNRVLIGGMAGHWSLSADDRRLMVALPARLSGLNFRARNETARTGENVIQFEGFRDARRHEQR